MHLTKFYFQNLNITIFNDETINQQLMGSFSRIYETNLTGQKRTYSQVDSSSEMSEFSTSDVDDEACDLSFKPEEEITQSKNKITDEKEQNGINNQVDSSDSEYILESAEKINQSLASYKRRRTLLDKIAHEKIKHSMFFYGCRCRKRCYEYFSENERSNIHTQFWEMDNYTQRLWIAENVTEISPKHKCFLSKKRQFSRIYTFPRDIENRVVCKLFFLSTLGLKNDSKITFTLKAKKDKDGNQLLIPIKDQRGVMTPTNKKNHENIRSHIRSFKPHPSHYRRSHVPNRLYLPPELTIKFMHQDFLNENHQYVCYESYRKIISELNIGFNDANTETCGICIELDQNVSAINTKKKDDHLSYAKLARCEYDNDAKIDMPNVKVFAGDMQKVVLLPRMPNVKESFFTPRLLVYNETFAAMQKNELHFCVLWSEATADRKMDSVSSAFITFLQANRDVEEIIIWLDNCGGQNKNFSLYSAILSYINLNCHSTKTICLKYLVKGHTYMAADGLHGNIEQRMRSKVNIYDFREFTECVQNSSRRMQIIKMEPRQFLNFPNIIRARKGKNDSIPFFSKISVVKFIHGSSNFFYKTNFDKDFVETTETLRKNTTLIEVKENIHARPRGVCENKKKKILKDLVAKMPKERRQFWENLTASSFSKDLFEDE